MVSKVETGATGARFQVFQRLADALGVDPAELFTSEIASGAIYRGPLVDVTTQLSGLSLDHGSGGSCTAKSWLRDRINLHRPDLSGDAADAEP